MSALADYRRFTLTITGFKTTHEARVVAGGFDEFRLYAGKAIAELEAENERLRDLISRCMKVGCQWCGLPAVSPEVEQRVMRQAGAERSTP